MSDLDKALASLQFSAQGRAVLDHINRLSAENERLRGALSGLVSLKEIKEKHGKTEGYMVGMPIAWELAKASLGKEE